MKTILIYSVLALLTLGFSCKPKPANEPIPDLTKCRIVKEIYKTTTGQQGSSESVKVEGKTYRVRVSRITTCIYDDQGRLITERYITSRGDTGLVQYRYELRYIVKTSQYKVVPPLTSSSELDTIYLNEQGFISRQINLKYQYNEQGYRVRSYTDDEVLYRYQIENENLIKTVFTINYGAINQQTVDYTHDLTKSNLPNRYPFLGRTSRNLVVKRLGSIDKVTDTYQVGPAYETRYYYTYDAYGRVKRQINLGKSLNPTFGLETDPEGLGITDYEYACN